MRTKMSTKAFVLTCIVLIGGALSSISQAQVTTNITSSGLGTAVSPISSGVVTITGGTRAGTNLFHSFGLFNVGAGDTANFFNNTGLPTTNILSRVTGGGVSNIFGTIETTGFGGANLFLINPFGVVFGPNASLNIGGSFHVSTADYVRMSDNTLFIANPAYEGAVTKSGTISTVLSSADPAAFGFLSPNPAPITVQGSTLAVGPGQTMSFVGGDITITADPVTGNPSALTAPGGQINLVSVASPGEILLPGMQTVPNVNGDSFTTMGTITLDQGTLSTAGDASFGDGSGGAVLIRGGQLVATGAQILTNPASGSAGQGGTVDVTVTGTASFTNNSTIDTSVYAPASGASGNAGSIGITASNVNLQDSSLTAVYFGDGTTTGGGGAVILTGTNSVNLTRTNVDTATFFSNADGGAVTIRAPIVMLEDSGIVTGALGDGIDPMAGNGGAVTLAGTTSVSLTRSGIDTSTYDTTGNSGPVTIAAPTVTIVGTGLTPDINTQTVNDLLDPLAGNGSDIAITATSATLNNAFLSSVADGPGTFSRGGNIHINGSESVLVTSGTILLTTTTSQAKAGDIQLEGKNVTVTGTGTLIESDTLGQGGSGTIAITGTGSIALGSGSLISTSSSNAGPTSTGAAGNIELNGGLVTIGGGSLVRGQTNTPGNGGTITVNANQVQLSNGTISAQSSGTGNAGNISITAGDSLVMQNGTISTATTQSDGGNINIHAGRLVQLTDSQITTSVQGGLGNGGNITIDPQFVILSGSQILANAFGGNGGNISITAGTLLMDPSSTISASSTFGVSGTVNIQASVTNLSETVAPLSGEFMQTPELLHVRCAARFQGGQYSSFVVAGRDGLPQEPGGFLPSPLFTEHQGSPRLSKVLDVPSLRSGRTLGETNLALAPLETGCAS